MKLNPSMVFSFLSELSKYWEEDYAQKEKTSFFKSKLGNVDEDWSRI